MILQQQKINNRNSTHQYCKVCMNQQTQYYSICKCPHQFCLQCCQETIKTNLLNFTKIKCIQEQCDMLFDDHSIPFISLPQSFKQKYEKYKRFEYFQKHPQLKSCPQQTCDGQISIQKNPTTCNKCLRQYCNKCMKQTHVGQCSVNVDQMMNRLNYKKCKKCQAYVQKIEGCNYVTCKCGNYFCYACGQNWETDPCRIRPFQILNNQIRQSIIKIRISSNFTWKNFICKLVFWLFKLLILLLTIIIGVFVIPCLIVIILLITCVLLSPLLVLGITLTSSMTPFQKWAIIISVIFLYPVVSIIITLLISIYLLLFFFLKNANHDGIYDGVQASFLGYVVRFLRVFVYIVQINE